MKTIWTDVDLESLNWHDASVHAIAPAADEHELWLDLDYILEWLPPEEPDGHFLFVVAPATLIFRGVWDMSIDLASVTGAIVIDGISRSDESVNRQTGAREWTWLIDTDQGSISFRGTGFQQILRDRPRPSMSPRLSLAERGGISFG